MNKKYQIIYADPPWGHNDKMETHSFSQLNHYKTMTTNEISSLDVASLSDKDCVLFLWAVSPMLEDALKVMERWGFQYKTIAFCWSKIESQGAWVHNLGRWTMGNVELCLLGVKGHPKRIIKNIKQLVVALRAGHSKKPDIVRKRIVELMGNLPRIELFARDDGNKDMFNYNRLEGWDCWGNEVDSDIELDTKKGEGLTLPEYNAIRL